MSYYATTTSQIWMGSLEPHMTEAFITNAFKSSGENPTRVKIMRDKNTGAAAGFCFVHFANEECARTALHKLNGKVIPNTFPPIRFKLNYADTNAKPNLRNDVEYSLFVGDLSPEVDDYMLYKCFAARYRSVRTAKVVLDANGFSKGYAFIRFALEAEQKKCITEMNGYVGLGTKAIKIASAIPRIPYKKPDSSTQANRNNTVVPTYDYTQAYYDPAALQSYSWQSSYYHQQSMLAYTSFYPSTSYEGNDDMELIEHGHSASVDEMNQAVLARDCDFWDSIENSKWSPVEVV